MNDKFGLPTSSYSVSDIQDYLEYIIKKHKLSATNPLTHVTSIEIIKDYCLKEKMGIR